MTSEMTDDPERPWAEYREGIIATAIAIVVEGVNWFAFDHSQPGTILAVSVALVGLLLVITRLALQSYIKATFRSTFGVTMERVERLTEIADLSVRSNVSSISGLLETYLRVGEPEFAPVRRQIVEDAAEKMRKLAVEKRTPVLETPDYYAWLFDQFDNVREGGYIHAVSLSSDLEWNDSQVEKKFLEKNLESARSGVKVSRIFVAREETLAKFIKLPPIEAHTKEVENGLVGYWVSRNQLEKAAPDLLKSIREGFIDFNGHVALEDVFDSDGGARGEVTLLPADLERMQSIYMKLQNMAEPLSKMTGLAVGTQPDPSASAVTQAAVPVLTAGADPGTSPSATAMVAQVPPASPVPALDPAPPVPPDPPAVESPAE